MEMKIFKTNIKCSGCVEKITPGMDAAVGKTHWTVDLASPDKWLTVNADNAIPDETIIKALAAAGYKATKA